jgi:acetolactate synthase-1/2/3 large subunit
MATTADVGLTRLTGAQIVAEYLIRAGVPYATGIPGHGSWTMVDAIARREGEIRLIPVMHEQSAAHLADAYFRASGRPIAAFTSIGPGAANTTVGVATAYVDSSAFLLLIGSVHTHMQGRSVLQEVDRTHDANFARVLEPIVKRWWQPSRVEMVPFALHRAFNEMLSGRPGPVLLDLPMDVQADDALVSLPAATEQRGGRRTRQRPDAQETERAARLLASAERPVIVAGGGAITGEAAAEVVALAEYLGAPVVTTWMGKGSIPEDHVLNGWSVGDTASTSGNQLAAAADVVLSVGCRFTDWSASSYRKGVSFAIPPTKLIQVDVDPHEIGKNYPAEAALIGDAQAALRDLLDALRQTTPSRARTYRDLPYFGQVQKLKGEWEQIQAARRDSPSRPINQTRALYELRQALDRRTIVTSGAGVVQASVRQDFPVYEPRTHLTSGGYSTMGFTVPAAIGAKLAQPDRTVVGIAGDGDFLQTMQELATAAMLGSQVLFVVLNNSGWISIKGGQMATFGQISMTDFKKPDGSIYSPAYAEIARNFGLHGERVADPAEIGGAVRRALATQGPALLEITVARDYPEAGATKAGWWDAPVPTYLPEKRRAYDEGRAEEQP